MYSIYGQSLAIRHEGKRFLTMHQLSLYLSNINGEDRVAYKSLLEKLYPL